jgi:hypothetical protein
MADLERLYARLARAIVGAIDGPWVSATVRAEATGRKVRRFGGMYVATAGAPPSRLRVDTDARVALAKARKTLASTGKPVWTAATFTLDPSGTFTMNLEY